MTDQVVQVDPKIRARRQRQLVGMALLFLAPVISAYVAWKLLGADGVAGTTNVGTLITPARPLPAIEWRDMSGALIPADKFSGRWVYLILAPESCDEACMNRLYVTRQTWIGMNKDQPRIARLLLIANLDSAQSETLKNEHSDLLVAKWESQQIAQWLAIFAQQPARKTDGSEFFLIDPLGNLMMMYNDQSPPRGLFKDIKKLLKISQVG